MRDQTDSWEVSLFAKNLFNRFVLLYKSATPIQETGGLNATFGSPGYFNATVTPPMQIGVNARYAFGSR